MPSSMMTSTTRIATLFSLVALSALTLTVVFGSNNILDTLRLTRDTLANDSPFLLPKHNIIIHHRRALHHARATSAAASGSSQANPAPSEPAASSPAPANTQAPSPAPVASPSPSPSPPPSAQSSPAPASSSQAPATSASPGSSAASASSSPSPSSAASATASSTLSNQASSTRSVTGSSAGATSNTANSATSLLYNPISFTTGNPGSHPTSTGSTLTINATPTGVGGASSGFFRNKAAVGATFSIVGIVGGLAVIMTVLTITKRHRRSRRRREDEEFFEKYQSVDFAEPVPHTSQGFGTLSASDMDFSMNAAPPDAYPDRAVHYGQTNPGTVLNPGDYGISYPPSAVNKNSTPANGNGSTHEDTESAYSTPSASHPFADPVNTSANAAAPPVTYPRYVPGRAQEMVTTDSYYGPNSAGLGAGSVGYAQ